jgi:hypothetical protein
MRMASKEGYDVVAWTPGKMQAERYDLSKHISEIHLSGTNLKAYGLNGEVVISQTGVTSKDLPELIGKEAADRLLAQEAKGGLRSLTGQDLEIGGEGMKGFYDKMLKKYAEKFGKKFGAKVGVTQISTNVDPRVDPRIWQRRPRPDVWSLPVTKEMRDSAVRKGVPLFGAAAVATGAVPELSERK